MAIDPNELKRLRGQASLSQKALATEAKVSQQLIAALERGAVSSTKHIYAIAKALGVGADRLDSAIAEAMDRSVDEITEVSYLAQPYVPNRREHPFPPAPTPRSGEYAIPVLGIRPALESDDFDAFVSNDAVEHLTWKDGEGRIGLFAPNDSLAPRIEAGDTLLLQFGRPIKKRTYMAVFDKPVPRSAAPDYSTRVVLGVVASWTDEEWILEKSNPHKEIRLSRKEWPYSLPVTGALFG